MPIEPVVTGQEFLEGQAKKETVGTPVALTTSLFGGADDGMEAQIHIDMIVQCPRCKMQYKKSVRYYTKGQAIELACEDCARKVRVFINGG